VTAPSAAALAAAARAHKLMSDDSPPGWRGLLLRMGRARAVLAITALSVAVSLLVTATITLTLGQPAQLLTDLLVATIVPLLVAPLVSGAAMGLLAEVETARRALREVAIRDGLTNLYNRRFFAARLGAEIYRARREETPLALILIDVDHFKRINDAWGHATGDEVLCRVADTLMAFVRPYDLSARFGGEEFVALLPGTTLAEAAEVANRIRLAIQALSIPALQAGQVPHVTASLGVASLGPHPDDGEGLLQRADQAMYEAKAAGRNRCICAPVQAFELQPQAPARPAGA